jgi:peptide/nickel transport system permease protein
MLQYILRRILLFIPSLFFITLAAFFINALTPGDPVSRILGAELDIHGNADTDDRQYRIIQHQLGLDLPLFYFSFGTLADPDSLFMVKNSLYRRSLLNISRESGEPEKVMTYYRKATEFIKKHPSSAEAEVIRNALAAETLKDVSDIYQTINEKKTDPLLENEWNKFMHEHWLDVRMSSLLEKKYIPVIRWNGYNQYHRWVFGDGDKVKGPYSSKGLIRGDFGRSLANGRQISEVLKDIAIIFYCNIIADDLCQSFRAWLVPCVRNRTGNRT